jgi:ABC-type protease/lipase transport system fused ATPase/permease subunit
MYHSEMQVYDGVITSHSSLDLLVLNKLVTGLEAVYGLALM